MPEQVNRGGTGSPTAAGARTNLGLGKASSVTFTNLTLSGNLSVAGTSTLTGNTTVGGTLGVTGATTLASLTATTGSFSSTLAVSGVTTFSSRVDIDSTIPAYRLIDNDGAVDAKVWQVYAPANLFRIQTLSDALAGGSQVFDIRRSGNNITNFEFGNSGGTWLNLTSTTATFGVGIVMGATLYRSINDNTLHISGGTDFQNGGAIILRGGAHATEANDLLLYSNNAEVYRYDQSDGQHEFQNVVSLEDGHLKFPATANPSADANTLDEYEENTWTPACAFETPGTSSFAYTTQVGTYIKIGRLVTVHCNIVFTPTIGTGTGIFNITGLPFTSTSHTGSGAINTIGGTATWNWPASVTSVAIGVRTSDTRAIIQGNGNGINTTNFTQTALDTGVSHTLVFTATYMAAN